MTRGSWFKRASKSATRRVRSLRASMAMVIGDVLAQPAPERFDRHQIRAVTRQRHQGDVQRGQPPGRSRPGDKGLSPNNRVSLWAVGAGRCNSSRREARRAED